MDWTDLDPDKRLTYLIGDIVRSDVFLECEARGVFRIVSQVSRRPPAREHRDLAPLLDSIKDSLRGLVVDEFATEMARHAVIEAAAAHKLRSGPVHDYWMHQGGADERWVSVQSIAKAPAVEATAMVDCYRARTVSHAERSRLARRRKGSRLPPPAAA